MSTGPGRLSLAAEIVADGLGAAVAAALAACRATAGLPAAEGWHTADAPAPRMDPVNEALPGVMLAFASRRESGVVFRGDAPGQFTFGFDSTAPERPPLRAMAALTRQLARRGVLRFARLQRDIGGHCLPVLPLVEDATHLLACAPAAVARDYVDAGAFGACWDAAEAHGGLHLFARALDATGNPDFLRAVLPGHLAMAQLARPGTVRFYPPRFADGEFALLEAGEPTLTGIGYDAADGTYEFAGHLLPGVTLRLTDLLAARRLVARGEIEGHKVRRVRAVFMDEAQARRAAPLLRAAGVLACWEDADGRMRQLA